MSQDYNQSLGKRSHNQHDEREFEQIS